MNDTRPCLVTCEETKWKGDSRHKSNVIRKATFHRFAGGTKSANEVEVPCMYALVEFEDGNVKMVNPNTVQFADKPIVESLAA